MTNVRCQIYTHTREWWSSYFRTGNHARQEKTPHGDGQFFFSRALVRNISDAASSDSANEPTAATMFGRWRYGARHRHVQQVMLFSTLRNRSDADIFPNSIQVNASPSTDRQTYDHPCSKSIKASARKRANFLISSPTNHKYTRVY